VIWDLSSVLQPTKHEWKTLLDALCIEEARTPVTAHYGLTLEVIDGHPTGVTILKQSCFDAMGARRRIGQNSKPSASARLRR
jgi:hypothetical protein